MSRNKRDWRDFDEITIETTAELAKVGYQGVLNPHDSNKSDLLKQRGDLRRAINAIKDRTLDALDKHDDEEFTRLHNVIHHAGALMDRLDDLIQCKDMAAALSEEMQTGAASAGDGNKILSKDQSLHAMNNSAPNPGFGFGSFVQAMVAGTNNPDIRNALTEGTDSAGGFTVPTYIMQQLIDRMRAKTTVVNAGALTVPLDTEKTTVARLASDPNASWRLENAAVAESDPTFEAITFQARSLACLVKVSRELLEDSINIENALLDAFAGSMAVELDRVALLGTGTAPEPRGIVNTTNVNAVDMGTNGAAITDYSDLLDAMLELENDNAGKPSGMIMAPRTWRTIAGLTDTTGQPLAAPVAVAEIPQLVSTTVPVDQTHGTATNASTIIMGDFSQLMIGVRTSLRIEVLRELFAENMQYGFLAHLRFDVQLAHPESFVKIEGIIP